MTASSIKNEFRRIFSCGLLTSFFSIFVGVFSTSFSGGDFLSTKSVTGSRIVSFLTMSGERGRVAQMTDSFVFSGFGGSGGVDL